jgi:hypothetical protein
LYTDGLIERRNEAITTGIERLEDCLRSWTGDDIEALADHILEQCLPVAIAIDDVCLLLAQTKPLDPL